MTSPTIPVSQKAGGSGLCSECYRDHWEKVTNWDHKKYRKEYYRNNSDKLKKQSKDWRRNNRERENAYYAAKRQDPQYKIAHNIRSRLHDAMKGKIKHKPTKELTGCTWDELAIYLENQFDKQMTWENYGKYWSIDHIKPLIAFDLEDEEQLERATHFSNLQPLPVIINSSKASRDKLWKKN